MFPKDNMTRDANTLGYWIPTSTTFVFSAITKKRTQTSTRFKFSILMGLKEDKTSTTKHLERLIIWSSEIKTLKRRDITKYRGRETIYYMDSSKSNFTPSALGLRG